MAEFLSLLASIAIIISAKDKEQRIQAVTQIISCFATVAQIMKENVSSDEPSLQNPEVKRTCNLLLEEEEFLELCHEKRAELRALLTKILTECQEENFNA